MSKYSRTDSIMETVRGLLLASTPEYHVKIDAIRAAVERMEAEVAELRAALVKPSRGGSISERLAVDEKTLDAAVDAYCKAWAESFMAANPYEIVQPFAKDLREHITAGLRAAYAVSLQVHGQEKL